MHRVSDGEVWRERTTRAPQIFEEGPLLALPVPGCSVQSFGPLPSRYVADCRADGQGWLESGLRCFDELLTPEMADV